MPSQDKVLFSTRRTKMIGDKMRFDVEAKLYSFFDQAPYFSITGELRNMRRAPQNQVECCGCMHDEVMQHFPELEPILLVHLSNEHGVPMHAVQNALYWLGLLSTKPRDDFGRTPVETDPWRGAWSPAMSASHLRISDDNVRELRENLILLTLGRSADEYAFFLQAHIDAVLSVQWQAEADAAIALMQPVA